MPYVDQGDPKPPPSLPPVVPIIVALLMAGVGVLAWIGSFNWFGMSYPGAIAAGLLIGLGIKFTLTRPFPPLRVIAIVLTVLASLIGYILVFKLYYTNFALGPSIAAYFKDIQALLFTGVGCYLAFILAAPRAVTRHAPHEQDPQ